MNVPTLKTKKAARAAGYQTLDETLVGYRIPRLCEQPLIVKSTEFWAEDQLEEVLSITAGRKRLLTLRRAAQPVAAKFSRRYRFYFKVYRRSDFKAAVQRLPRAPVAVDLLKAIFTVNRSAKRYRDAASAHYSHRKHAFARAAKETKEALYELKDDGIATAYRLGRIAYVGLAGGLAVYRGEGYCFHSTLIPEGVELTEVDASDPIFVESKARTKDEPRLKDAVFTLEKLDPDFTGFDVLPAPTRRTSCYRKYKDDGNYDDEEWVDDGDE